MATSLLVIGASGSGKSASLRNLDPKETFIANVAGKQLPFKSGYKLKTKEDPLGNMRISDSAQEIIKDMEMVSKARPWVKYFIVDDAQYVMANYYMRHVMDTGDQYQKFRQIGMDMFALLDTPKTLRGDLHVVFLWHPDIDDLNGKKWLRAKTIGKMVDQYITVEGMFSIVLFADAISKDKKMHYGFRTTTDGTTTAKTPMGMFEDDFIENDLKAVLDAVDSYYGVDLTAQQAEAATWFGNEVEYDKEAEERKAFIKEEVKKPKNKLEIEKDIRIIRKSEDDMTETRKRTDEIIKQLPKDMQPQEDSRTPIERVLACEKYLKANSLVKDQKQIYALRKKHTGTTSFIGDHGLSDKTLLDYLAVLEEFLPEEG